MILRSALLVVALLLLSATLAMAQPASPLSTSPSPQTQLDRIEGKLDELLRRLPTRVPDSQPAAASAPVAAPGRVPSPDVQQPDVGAAGASAAAEYRPGALAVVRPAPASDAVLAAPADSVGGFVFTGGTLRLDDLASRGVRYRGSAGTELQGWLRVRESGRYQVAVDFGSPQAGSVFATLSCGIALWLEDRQVGQRTGNLALSPGSGTGLLSLVLGAELQPGLYKLRFWIACGRTNPAQPVPVTADVLLKAPAEMNLRLVTGNDLLHREG